MNSIRSHSLAYEVAIVAILGSLITAQQLMFILIPNVSLTAMLVVLFSFTFKFKRSLSITMLFVFVRNIAFASPMNIWVLYIVGFLILNITSYIVSKISKNVFAAAIIVLLFGLTFGFMDALINLLLYDMGSVWVAYWIKGLPLDVIHGMTNFIAMIVLFEPLKNIIEKINK